MDAVLLVALATIDVRLTTVELDNLPRSERWRYRIFCQRQDEKGADLDGWAKAAHAARPDVDVVFLKGRGVAASRNAAVSSCETELLLFTDDDVRVPADGLAELIAIFEARPDLDIVAGRTLTPSGALRKRYPPAARRLTPFNSAHIGTVELAVRARRVQSAGIGFDTDFGVGTENFVGDEYIFVTDCLKAGLRGECVPVALAVHPELRSALDFWSERSARARARVFERVFPVALVPAIKLAFLMRQWRRAPSIGAALWFARHFLPRQRR
jgi:hypothetical protein